MTPDIAGHHGSSSIYAERTIHATPQEVFALLATPPATT